MESNPSAESRSSNALSTSPGGRDTKAGRQRSHEAKPGSVWQSCCKPAACIHRQTLTKMKEAARTMYPGKRSLECSNCAFFEVSH